MKGRLKFMRLPGSGNAPPSESSASDSTANAGESLRLMRDALGLTMREVEAASNRIAARYRNQDYSVSPSRLSDLETKAILPSIYKLYSLAVIYRSSLAELLALYGVTGENLIEDLSLVSPPKTHLVSAMQELSAVEMPVRMDPGFDPRFTTLLSRFVEKWGSMPVAFLKTLQKRRFAYAFIGSDDCSMAPLLLPGSFLQIDEALTRIEEGPWHSEYQRPIYFVETRKEFVCGWCEVNGNTLVLKAHPMSGVRTRAFRLLSEAEVIGQVVGVAMRLDGWISAGDE